MAARFILLHHFREKGKFHLAIYDKKKHYFFTLTLRQYRDRAVLFWKHGIEKGENYE